MPEKRNKIENQEASDLIGNAIKENSENLKMLLNRVSMISDRMDNLQNEITTLCKFSPQTTQENQTAVSAGEVKEAQRDLPKNLEEGNPFTVLRFKNWEDFQAFASQPKTVCFTYRESDKVFEADALKNNQLAIYVGEMPKPLELLKYWISSQLKLPGERVFEGTLTKS